MVVDERIRLVFPRILGFVVIGAGYGYETSIAAGAGLRGLIRGALTGGLIGGAVTSLRVFVLQAPGTRLARASFMVTVAVRSLVYLWFSWRPSPSGSSFCPSIRLQGP